MSPALTVNVWAAAVGGRAGGRGGGAGAIVSLETSGSMVVRSLVLLLKGLCCAAYAGSPRVLRVLGAAPRCELGPNADPPALPPHLDREAMRPPAGEVESCDVVVVGSGAGGAAAARVLAEAGLDVLVVEEGEYYDALTYSRDPLHARRRQKAALAAPVAAERADARGRLDGPGQADGAGPSAGPLAL